MKKRIINSVPFICLFLFCVNEYNPFKDLSNVKVMIDSYSFSDKDSVKLFSAETLHVSLTMKDHIDSFSLQADNNRLWTDTTVYGKIGLEDTYSFFLSFKDTGNAKISIFLFRDNGTGYSEDISCRIYSPLYQEPITGTFDDSINLSTPSVDDHVKYHWDFGRDPAYWSYSPSLRCLVTNAADDSIGWLWVSDESGTHHSPKSPFTFALDDTTGPGITCINTGIIPGTDTVKTGDTTFAFKVYITDRINTPVKEASINGSAFDYIDKKNNIYTHIIDSLTQYTSSSPLALTVNALDYDSNPSIRTFMLYFDESMDPTPKTIILIKSVNADTIFTSTTLYSLFGEVINIEQQPITLKLLLNDQQNSSIKTFNTGNGEWFWQVTLEKDTINPISIIASDTNNNSQAQEHIAIYHDSHLADTGEPEIVSITVSGMNPASMITPEALPTVTVTAYDKMSYVKEVTIAGHAASDSLGYIWSSTITLLHGKNYLDIACKDSAENRADTTITVYHNTLPFLTGGLSFPDNIVKGETYSDTLKPYDFDNDTVSVTIADTSIPGLTINNQTNVITWQTDSVSLDTTVIQLKLHDGFEDTILQWKFKVIDSTDIFLPVGFKTAVDDFPKYLIAGSGQLSCTLSVIDTTGMRPFVFNASIQDLDTNLLYESPDSTFQWIPGTSDTGYHQLIITVTDAQNTSDTLLPAITVIPENQYECSLSVVSLDPAVQIDYTTYTLDLSEALDTIMLAYVIHDLDHPFTEHFHVTKKIGNISSTFDPDSTSFTIGIIPRPNASNDTLTVTLTDKTGTPFTITLVIVHPALISPTEVDNLVYWFDTTDPMQILDSNDSQCNYGDEVYKWINKLGTNTDTLHKANSPPNLNRISDFFTLHFNRSAKNCLITNNPEDWANNPFTVFVIARLDSKQSLSLLSVTEGDLSFSFGVHGGSMGVLYQNRLNGQSIIRYSASLIVEPDSMHLLSYMKNQIGPGKIQVFLNGREDSIDPPGAMTGSITIVGANFQNNSDHCWDGDIAEILIYNRSLDKSERNKIETYLADKYPIKLNK